MWWTSELYWGLLKEKKWLKDSCVAKALLTMGDISPKSETWSPRVGWRESLYSLAELSLFQAAQHPSPSVRQCQVQGCILLSVRQLQAQQCIPPLSETVPVSALLFSTWPVVHPGNDTVVTLPLPPQRDQLRISIPHFYICLYCLDVSWSMTQTDHAQLVPIAPQFLSSLLLL